MSASIYDVHEHRTCLFLFSFFLSSFLLLLLAVRCFALPSYALNGWMDGQHRRRRVHVTTPFEPMKCTSRQCITRHLRWQTHQRRIRIVSLSFSSLAARSLVHHTFPMECTQSGKRRRELVRVLGVCNVCCRLCMGTSAATAVASVSSTTVRFLLLFWFDTCVSVFGFRSVYNLSSPYALDAISHTGSAFFI